MPQRVSVPVSSLLLDEENARLGVDTASQQEAALLLAKKQGRKLVRLAESIQAFGLDPAQLPSIILPDRHRNRYVVLEGNRRVLALKALETPALIQGALSAPDFKKFQAISRNYAATPIEDLECVLYDRSEAETAYDWVVRRHTGAQEGAGLVDWESDEKDRFAARRGKKRQRSLGGQALDFLASTDGHPPPGIRIATSLTRLLSSPDVRERLGLERSGGLLIAHYPADQIGKALRKVVDDLSSGRVRVKDVYTAGDRRAYAANFPDSERPKTSTILESPTPLSEMKPVDSSIKTRPAPPPKTRRRSHKPRATVAAPNSRINPTAPRAAAVYDELLRINAGDLPNAGAVLLRVFLEISVDAYVKQKSVMTEPELASSVLAKRMKAVADHLAASGRIDKQLKKAVYKIADGQHTLAASVTAFHQYVHNEYVYPKPSELQTSWDEIQPFLEAIWP